MDPGASPHPTNVIPYTNHSHDAACSPSHGCRHTRPQRSSKARLKNRHPMSSRSESTMYSSAPPPSATTDATYPKRPLECFSATLVSTSHHLNPCLDTSPSSSHAQQQGTCPCHLAHPVLNRPGLPANQLNAPTYVRYSHASPTEIHTVITSTKYTTSPDSHGFFYPYSGF